MPISNDSTPRHQQLWRCDDGLGRDRCCGLLGSAEAGKTTHFWPFSGYYRIPNFGHWFIC